MKEKKLVKSLSIAANEIWPDIQIAVYTEQLSKLITELSRLQRCLDCSNKEMLISLANVEIITESIKTIFEEDLEFYDYDSILAEKIDIFNNRILAEVRDIED